MKYALIINGVVKQVQPNYQDDFIEVNDNVVCGMIQDSEGNFSIPVVTKTVEELKEEEDLNKQQKLNNLIVTISTGKRFYADPESRTDLLTAVLEIIEQNIPDSFEIDWKTPDGIIKVTALEMKEAKRVALEEKGKIIGV